MKAKVIETGEILKIADYATIKMDACDSWGNPLEFKPEEIELLYEETTQNNEIDWEQRRFELVKSVFPIVIQKKQMDYDLTIEQFAASVAIVSINYADAVIAKLKNE